MVLQPGKKGLNAGANRLVWDDVAYGSFNKTLKADTYYYSKETYNTGIFCYEQQNDEPKTVYK